MKGKLGTRGDDLRSSAVSRALSYATGLMIHHEKENEKAAWNNNNPPIGQENIRCRDIKSEKVFHACHQQQT